MKKLLIILSILIAIGIVYFGFIADIEVNPQPPGTVSPPPAYLEKNFSGWKNMLPDILTALKNESWEFKIEESRTISIFKEADITGDDAPEALIDLGSGGAYTAYLTLMRIENNKAVIARFQKKDGAISHLAFLNGSSAKNGVKTEFSGKDQSLYDMRWSANEQSLKIDTCTVEAYQWNGKTKIFEFNPDLSNKIKNDQCGKLQLNQ